MIHVIHVFLRYPPPIAEKTVQDHALSAKANEVSPTTRRAHRGKSVGSTSTDRTRWGQPIITCQRWRRKQDTMKYSESPYLTCAEVAARWRCSRSTVFRRIKTGHLEAVGRGALLRVTRESMLRYEATLRQR